MPSPQELEEIETRLVEDIAEFYYDPYGYALYNWDWDSPPLNKYGGLDNWQIEFLETLGEECLKRDRGDTDVISRAVRIATGTGHGCGKTLLASIIIHWFSATRPNPQAIVTANTKDQLSNKTWRELGKLNGMALNGHWFEHTATKFIMKSRPKTWYATAVPWSEGNSEAFAGTHEASVLMLFDEACHDDQTDVMTEYGWMRFAELDGTERLLTMDPETLVAEYVLPVALTRHQYAGPMYEYAPQRGSNFCVTPGHRMWTASRNGKTGGTYGWRFRPMREIDGLKSESMIQKTFEWNCPDRTTYRIPGISTDRISAPPVDVPMDDWCIFMGWYCSEGHINYRRADGAPHAVGITNTEDAAIEDCIGALERMGIRYAVHLVGRGKCRQVCVNSIQLAAHLYELGDGCLEKRVPEEVRHASRRQIELFLDRFLWGDGYTNNGRRIFYTSSERMAGDLQELIYKTGAIGVVTERELTGQQRWIDDHYATSTTTGYVITENLPSHAYIRHYHIKKQLDYDGTVYCATLPKHELLFTRRKGHAMWSGNSAIADIIWEVAEGAMTTPGAVFLAFGNRTRNTGRFSECWKRFRDRWITFEVDCRTSRVADQAQIQEWINDYGLDSDFVKVRVLGKEPYASEMQLIPANFVDRAVERRISLRAIPPALPRLMGADCGAGGQSMSVIVRRQGSKMFPEINRWNVSDPLILGGYFAEQIKEWNPDVFFIDAHGIGLGTYSYLIQLGFDNVVPVYWGDRSLTTDKQVYYNPRIECWARMREWLRTGDIPDDRDLKQDLIGPIYTRDMQYVMRLERKEDMAARGLPSPDTADALACTFFHAVPVKMDHYTDEDLDPEVE